MPEDQDPMSAPDFLFHIPHDETPEVQEYLRAQAVIQAAFYSLGDRSERAGTATLGTDEIRRILAVALAMLLAVDKSLKTPRDVRVAADGYAKLSREYASMLREAGDETIQKMLDMLHMQQSSPS